MKKENAMKNEVTEVIDRKEAAMAMISEVENQVRDQFSIYLKAREYGDAIQAALMTDLGALPVGSFVVFLPELKRGNAIKIKVAEVHFAEAGGMWYRGTYVKGDGSLSSGNYTTGPKGSRTTVLRHEDLMQIDEVTPKTKKAKTPEVSSE